MTSVPRRRRAIAAAAVAGITVVPALAIVATAAGARVEGDVYLERRWRTMAGGGDVQSARLALDLKHRTAYSFHSNGAGLNVSAWDLGTLKPRTAPLAVPASPIRAATPIAVDEAHGVALIAPVTAGAADVPYVGVFAARGRAMTRVGTAASRFPAGYAVLGMAVDAPRDRLLVLGAPAGGAVVKTAGAGVGNVLLDTWRLADLAAGRVTSESVQPLRVPPACGQVLTTTFPAGIMPSPDGKRVFFGCLSNRGFVTPLGPNAGDVSGVAELDLAAAATGAPTALRIRPVSGNFGQGDSFAVAKAGRFVLTGSSAATTTVKVLDTASGYYVGNVGLDSSIAAIGFDPASGRGYYVNNSGLGVFDAAATPVTQGVVYEDHATTLGILKRGIDVDPRTGRVFIVTADDVVNGPDPFVGVYRDRSARLSADVAPDEQGLDVAEVAGVYDSARTADAAALGAEYRMVGGPTNLIYNTSHFDSRGIVTRPGTRWLQLGSARSIRLTRDEASAEVMTVRYDDASAADANSTTLATPVQCADFGFTAGEKTEADSTVACDAAGQHVAGGVTAEPARVLLTRAGQATAVPAPVQVRVARSSAETRREADGTLVSTLTAEADGVDILGAVTIGRVTATASVTAHGRSGSAKTTYERSVSGVAVNGSPVCAGACSLDAVRDAVAQAFGGRVVVDFPDPFAYAAARGTAARLTDHPYRHIERALFEDVPDDSVLAPAMEVVVYLDGTASSRLVVGLASVSAQQRYRIYRVGADDLGPPAPPVAAEVPRAAAPGAPQPPVVIGDPAAPAPVALPPAVSQPPLPLVTRLAEGLKVVFRSPRQLASVAAVWALLAVPAYLAARRRLLIDLPYLRRAVEEQ